MTVALVAVVAFAIGVCVGWSQRRALDQFMESDDV